MERPPNRASRKKTLLQPGSPAVVRTRTVEDAEAGIRNHERWIFQKQEEIKRLRDEKDKYAVGSPSYMAASNAVKDAEQVLGAYEENLDALKDKKEELEYQRRVAVGHQRPRNRDERSVVSDSDVPDDRPPSVHSSMDHVPHEAPAALGSVRSLTPPPQQQVPAALDPDPDSPPEVKFEPRPAFPGPEIYAASKEKAGQLVGDALAVGKRLLGAAAAAGAAGAELARKKKREYDEAREAKRLRDAEAEAKRQAEEATNRERHKKEEEEYSRLRAEQQREADAREAERRAREQEEREHRFRQEQAAAALRHQEHLRRRQEALDREADRQLEAAQRELEERAQVESVRAELEAAEKAQEEAAARESALQFARDEAAREQQAIAAKRHEDELMNRLAREQEEALNRIARERAAAAPAAPVAEPVAGSMHILAHDPSDEEMEPVAGRSVAHAPRPVTSSRGSSGHEAKPPPLPPRPVYPAPGSPLDLSAASAIPVPDASHHSLPHDPDEAAATLVDMAQPPSVHRSRKRESQKRPRNLHLPVDVAPVPPPRSPPRSPVAIYGSVPPVPPPRSPEPEPELETEPIEPVRSARKKGRKGGGGGGYGGGAQIIPMRDPEEAQREIRAEVQKLVDERAEEKRVRKASAKAKAAAAKKTVVINVPAPVQEKPTQLVPVPEPQYTASIPPVEYHPLPSAYYPPSYSPYRPLMQQHAMALPHDPDEPERTHPRMMQQTMYW